jgi:hypothetical protein
MIVTKLIGGLGNQMFQYAAGKALAEKHKSNLLLDLNAYDLEPNNSYTTRKFELDVFNVTYKRADDSDISYFLKDTGKLKRLFARMFPSKQEKMVLNEIGHLYYEDFMNCPANTYLNGFWQCEKYFLSVREILMKEFSMKAAVPENIQQYKAKIENCNSVSLHVRRGDYVNLKAAIEFHGTCSLDYYENAFDFISSDNDKLNVFVFSDDINWCKENIKLGNPIFVEQNNGAEWDLFLMSKCKHNIIANSSFSWWGAWLNDNPSKIVTLPPFWFKNVRTESTGIAPFAWKIIETSEE